MCCRTSLTTKRGLSRTSALTAAFTGRSRDASTPGADGDLVDRDYGPWAGHTKEEVVAKWGSLDQAPGVETQKSLTHRAIGMLHKEFRAYPVVLVTHEVVLQAMLEHLDPTMTSAPQDLAAWDVVTRDETGRLHLDGADFRATQSASEDHLLDVDDGEPHPEPPRI
jgi:broad specificity phosphatase PhoE